jgi:hypothetical protein
MGRANGVAFVEVVRAEILVGVLVGTPQLRDLSNTKVKEVMKQVQVAVEVKLNKARLHLGTHDLWTRGTD